MKRFVQLIVAGMVFLVPLAGQWVFLEPTIGNYAPAQYARKFQFGINAGINLPAGFQVYGGLVVWSSSKETVSSDTLSIFQYFDAITRSNSVLLGMRENYRLGGSKYNLRIGVAYSIQTTATTSELLRYTNFAFDYRALGGTIMVETGLAIDGQNGGQLFLGIEYMMGELPYIEYAVEGRGTDLDSFNASRVEYGLAPLDDGFTMSGLIFKINYSITLGI